MPAPFARPRSFLTAFALIAFVSTVAAGAPLEPVARAAQAANPPAPYRVVDLGAVAPYDSSEASGVNDAGEVVGDSRNCTPTDCDKPYAVAWHVDAQGKATATQLPGRVSPTERHNGTVAYGVNDAGQVVGQSDNRPVTWTKGALSDLTAHLPSATGGAAYAINTPGEIVGTAGPLTAGGPAEQAMSWAPDTLGPTALQDLSGGHSDSAANAVDDTGGIVGFSVDQYGTRAFWTPAANQPMTDLLGMGPVNNEKVATGVNNPGEIVGYVGGHGSGGFTPGGWRATVFRPGDTGAPTDLGTLNNDPTVSSWANAVNDAGQIAGVSYTPDGWDHAVLWDADGKIHDLNDLIPADSSLYLDRAADINNDGEIVGWGYPKPRDNSWANGIYHAFLLVPTAPRIASVELTQATQVYQPLATLEHSLAATGSPPVRIVAGKPAAIRVYFTKVADPTSVVVRFSGSDGTTEEELPLDPACRPTNYREQSTIGSVVCWSADFFETPPKASWSFTLTVSKPDGTVLETHSFTVKTVTTKPLEIVPIPVCDSVVGTTWQCASVDDLAAKLPFLRMIYPGDVVLKASPSEVKKAMSTGNANDWNAILNQVNAAWKSDGADPNLNYFGSVRPAVPGLIGGMGFQPGNAASGKTSWVVSTLSGGSIDDAGPVAAHELFHNLGRLHGPPIPGCFGTPDPASIDPAWAYGTSPLVQQDGFAVSPGTPVLATTHADVMSYCAPAWISPYTYEGLISARETTAAAPTTVRPTDSATTPTWLVRGQLGDDGAHFDPLFKLDLVAPALPTGHFTLESLDADNNPLAVRHFDPVTAHFESYRAPPSFAETLPFDAAATKIVLLGPDDTQLGEIDLAGTAPSVAVTDPAPGAVVTGTKTIGWTVDDPDSTASTAWVQYSTDDGATWQTLSPDIAATQLSVDFDQLPGSDHARIRVVVSDGAHTSSATSGAFIVPSKPPSTKIISPATGASFRSGELVWLQGLATDPEQGILSGAEIHWTSSREGDLGTGDSLPLSRLSVGTHVITMAATDADGNKASDKITITVGSVSPPPTPPPPPPTPPPPPPSSPPPPAPPPPPTFRKPPLCSVPNVRHKSLARAKRSLAAHHCSVGRVTRKRSGARTGVVIAQSPKPGRRLRNGARVALVVSRGSPRKRP